MVTRENELIYTLQVEEVRPSDFVARALAFPNLLALGDTADEAITRATSLLTYQVRDARAHGDPIPSDVADTKTAGAQLVAIRIAA
jgi:predicted RNase H-like HicB family nuclease